MVCLERLVLNITFRSKGFLVCGSSFRTARALKRLVGDKDGTVSFEYVIVGAAVVGAVTLAFGTAGGAGPINDALTSALNTLVNNFTTAVGA
jgi:hypothetical protein